MHIPRGKDVTDEMMKSYDDNPDVMEDMDFKEMTMTLASKRKLKYIFSYIFVKYKKRLKGKSVQTQAR